MTDDELKKWEDRYRNVPIKDIQDSLKRGQFTNEQRKFLNDYLDRRRAGERTAEDEPEQKRFEQNYTQTERHHQESKRAARIAAVVSIIGALASWTGVWFQRHHSEVPVAPASPPPAVASPSPTQATDVNKLQGREKR